MIPSNWKKTKFGRGWLMSGNATEIGRLCGWTFFEHPTLGEDAPLIATHRNYEVAYQTTEYEMPEYL